MSRKKKKRVKRGHPVGILIGFDEEKAVFWRIYSEIMKQDIVIKRVRKRKNQDIKQLYHFNEDIVNGLRSFIKDGEKSVLLVSPPKKEYSKEFLNVFSKLSEIAGVERIEFIAPIAIIVCIILFVIFIVIINPMELLY